ncbi:unnamed protein product [Knipowitschia caucasica]
MSTSERPQTNSEEKDKEAMGEVTQVPIDGKGPLTLEESTLKQDPALDVLTSTDEVPSNVLEAAVSVVRTALSKATAVFLQQEQSQIIALSAEHLQPEEPRSTNVVETEVLEITNTPSAIASRLIEPLEHDSATVQATDASLSTAEIQTVPRTIDSPIQTEDQEELQETDRGDETLEVVVKEQEGNSEYLTDDSPALRTTERATDVTILLMSDAPDNEQTSGELTFEVKMDRPSSMQDTQEVEVHVKDVDRPQRAESLSETASSIKGQDLSEPQETGQETKLGPQETRLETNLGVKETGQETKLGVKEPVSEKDQEEREVVIVETITETIVKVKTKQEAAAVVAEPEFDPYSGEKPATLIPDAQIGRDKPTPVQKKVSATETDALKIPESSSTSAGADGTQLQGLGTPQETIAANEEEPESVMTNIFSEIQLLMESGPSCQLIQVKPVEPTPEAQFLSSAPDQDHVDQLLVRVLVCKNQPVPTSPRAAEGQLQEVQEVREASMVLLSLLCDLRREDQVSSQASELVEDQVRSWVQDLDSLVLKKQSELQLVSDYTHQQQQAQTGLEETRQDQASLSAGHNCSEEVQRLRSLQRTLEKRRSVLLQLKVLHKKLLLVLSRSDQASARDQLRNLQDQWRRVEREVQGSLYHKNAISYKTECLKAEVDLLTSQLQDISNELQMISTRGWTSNEAQKLMVLNAELSAACHKYSCLKDLAEEVSAHSQWEKDREEIRDGLQRVERELSQCQEDIGSKSQSSSNPIMEKILEVMRNAFAWARKTETDIEGRRRRVCLLPEQVHRQLRDLKKLQFEVTNKQGQLEALEEEVHELLPQLHEEDEAPMINASLKSLEELSKLTMEKLVQTIRETESGLQTRERLSQQLSDLETWILTYFSKDPFCSSDLQMSSQDLELQARRTLESQEEAEKQAAICEALLVTSKEIASELSVAENCHLFDRLLHLQDCIQDITEEEQSNKEEIQESIRMVESSRQKLVPIEKSLRHMLVDLSRPKFPVTRKSLLALRPLRNTLAEHKSQVERLERWSTQEKTKELQSLITNLETKMSALEPKATDHELYLDLRRFLEELKEAMKDQVRRAKDGSDDIHKYKRCQSLLVQFPTINVLCQEVKSKLQEISADLYPSQLSSEQQRQKQAEEALAAMETSLDNTLTIIEGTLLKHLDLQTETRSSRAFLNTTLKALDQVELQELSKPAVDGEYQRLLTLRRTIKLRLRAWDVLRRKGNKWEPATADINQLKTRVLQECDTQLEHLSEVRDSFRSFSSTLRRLVLVLVLVDLRLRRGVGPRGLCSERWQQIQSSLDSLDQDFQRLQDQLSSCFRANRLLPVSVVQQHLEETLSQLLLMKTTVKARARLQLEALSSCVEEQRLYCKLRDDVTQRLEKAEESVNELMSRRVSSLHDCEQQQQQLQTLSSELESLLRSWSGSGSGPGSGSRSCCPESSCRGHREATVVRVFSRLSSVWRHCHILRHRSNKRIRDWAQVTVCVEEAETTLSLLEQDLPSLLPLHSPIEQPLLPLLSPTEELAELVQTWDQFQDRVDCEQRSVLALELRVARLVGVSAHMDQAPPTALCQRLQGLHQQYQRVSESSSLGLSSCRSELEQRETTRGELQRLRLRLEETDHLLSQRHPRDIQMVLLQFLAHKSELYKISTSICNKYQTRPETGPETRPEIRPETEPETGPQIRPGFGPESLIPGEILTLLQETRAIMDQVEPKVQDAVEKSGSVYRLGMKLSEIQSGLNSVQKRLDQRSPTVAEAKVTQKRVWDELDVWHSCLAALEVEVQDLERPEEALLLTERLVEVQHIHTQLAKRAEQRTTLISKIHSWQQEHQEMILSSQSWINEAKTWLAAPATYTSAKCLTSHVHALQVVLGDSEQIRSTLRSFSLILDDMSEVCDITALQNQLQDQDRDVARVQDSFTEPLSRLRQAAAEAESIEAEVRQMEKDVSEIKELLVSPENTPGSRLQRLKLVEEKISQMQRTISEVQSRRLVQDLPQTLCVFTVIDHLHTLIQELHKNVPVLFVPQQNSPRQSPFLPRQTAEAPPPASSSPYHTPRQSPFMPQFKNAEEGEGQVSRLKEDVLKSPGAELQTVKTCDITQSTGASPSDGASGVMWWLWDRFVADTAQEAGAQIEARTEAETEVQTEAHSEAQTEAQTEVAGSIPESTTDNENPPPDPSESPGKSSRCVVS